MLQFQGEKEFARPVSDVWKKLRDASFLIGCIPEATVVGDPERDHAKCSIRPGFAFIRGTLEVNLDIAAAAENDTVKINLSSRGIGSSADVEAALNFLAEGEGCKVEWKADVVRLGGLLRAIPGGLIRGAAQKVIEDVWKTIGEKLQ